MPFPPDLSGFDRAEYDINGIRTVVLTIGSGPVLVFLHGTGTFPGFEMARKWAASHKVIIPYHPGFGDSGDAEQFEGIDDYALFYLDLFDKLALSGFDLAGFSLGGWLAAEIAIRQPQRIRRLVLVAPAGLVVETAPAPGLFDFPPEELPAYLAHDPANAARYFPAGPDPAFDAGIHREVMGFAKLIKTHPQGNPKLGAWLHRLTMPTLVIWGEKDRLRPTPQAKAWMDALPAGELALVPDTGHLVFEESPAAASLVTNFLAKHDQKDKPMTSLMPPGVTPAEEGFGGTVWSILGQTYTLKQHSESSMAWHAVFPPGTFVPPHIHPNQDEFVYVLSGRYDLWLDGKEFTARAGDLVRMPKGLPHGIFNKSGETATSLFWVAPTHSLKELFEQIHNVPSPDEVVRLAALHDVEFLPPPA